MEKYKISNRRYLGSKTKLLPFISDVIEKHCKDCDTFFDVFGGTGVVGYHFNDNYKIIENDLLYCNFLSHIAFLGYEKINEDKINELINNFNTIKPTDNYYSKNFADTYLSEINMQKVGAIRDAIDEYYENKKINFRERAILITALIYTIDHIANTVGHYDAYRKGASLNKELIIKPLDIKMGNNKGNLIFNSDSNELSKKVTSDIAYIDPPYNSRQYADSYHFLENVARNEKPEVEGVARKMDRSKIKSKYNTKSAPKAFEELIQSLDTRYILVSYNNVGEKANSRSNAKISDTEIISSLEKRGAVKVFEQDYNSFTTGKTKLEDHKERLFLCEVGVFDKNTIDLKESAKTQSPLNYTGGKFKLLPQLEKHFPQNVKYFYDVFCGGCNVGTNIEAENIVCVDNNEYLIELLNYLRSHTFAEVDEQLHSIIEKYGLSDTSEHGYAYYNCNSNNGVGKYNSKQFLKLRADYNKDKDVSKFLAIIFFSFNNQIRFNKNNEFNLPVGKRDYNKSLRRKLQGFINNIHSKNITFACMDFSQIKIETPEDTFLYLDPPYSLGIASYNENGGWTNKDDNRLLSFLTKCDDNNIRFALSNVIEHKGLRNNELIEWCIQNNFNIINLNYNYKNSSYHSLHKQSATKEVLITNYSP